MTMWLTQNLNNKQVMFDQFFYAIEQKNEKILCN